MALFPLDTIKTRLQSSYGFFRSGGFHGIYKGVLSAAVGSFPGGISSSCYKKNVFWTKYFSPPEPCINCYLSCLPFSTWFTMQVLKGSSRGKFSCKDISRTYTCKHSDAMRHKCSFSTATDLIQFDSHHAM